MQEFFEVWAAQGYYDSNDAMVKRSGIDIFDIDDNNGSCFGCCITAWLENENGFVVAALLMLPFTFLTSYHTLFSGKIRACGCFGDCTPLTPAQTFTKDIVLLILVLVVFYGRKYIKPSFFDTVNGTSVPGFFF